MRILTLVVHNAKVGHPLLAEERFRGLDEVDNITDIVDQVDTDDNHIGIRVLTSSSPTCRLPSTA